jgi:dTDP-4-dehydrorhamnose 3,5-epimerase
MIDGVMTRILKIIPDERGYLMEMLRYDDQEFSKFGQVYMTTIFPGVVKGWHYHLEQDDNFVVVKGMIKLVLYDRRKESKTHNEVNHFYIGEKNPILVHIPRGVVHGFKGTSLDEVLIINIVTEAYNYEKPDEYHLDPHGVDVPYDWTRKDG